MIRKAVNVTLGLVLTGSVVFAQSLDDAKKAIDNEQYQKAKTTLKNLTTTKPNEAVNYFYLGNVYMKTDYADSAKVIYNKGIAADDDFALNYIGLGAVDLESNNESAAKAKFDKAASMAKRKDYLEHLYIGKAYLEAPKPNYAAAVASLEKAKAVNAKDAEIHLALGDAYRGQKKNSEAYSAYGAAFDLDKSLLKAKVELGVINKQAKAYKESAAEFNSVLAINPNYAPAYRELAETYYLWASAEPKEYDARIKQALDYYKKYMELTDKSLESRMRYADFLILTKDYKTLQQEAQAMAQMDKANLRILRYLGYAAYENGNFAESAKALKDFMAKVKPERLIAQDYLYLGRAQMKDSTQAKEGIVNLKKAVEMDSTNAEVMSDIGKALFAAKKYGEAAEAYSIAANNTRSKTIVYDSFYLGMANYFDYAAKKSANQNPSKDILVQADSAFAYVAERSPTTAEAYLYRGRTSRQMDDVDDSQGLAQPFYEKYIEVVTVTKPELAAKNAKGLVEANLYLGIVAAKKDKNNTKAREHINKVLELDPSNQTAQQFLKAIADTN